MCLAGGVWGEVLLTIKRELPPRESLTLSPPTASENTHTLTHTCSTAYKRRHTRQGPERLLPHVRITYHHMNTGTPIRGPRACALALSLSCQKDSALHAVLGQRRRRRRWLRRTAAVCRHLEYRPRLALTTEQRAAEQAAVLAPPPPSLPPPPPSLPLPPVISGVAEVPFAAFLPGQTCLGCVCVCVCVCTYVHTYMYTNIIMIDYVYDILDRPPTGPTYIHTHTHTTVTTSSTAYIYMCMIYM